MNELEINKAVAEKLGHTFEVHPEGVYIVVHPEPFKSCRMADYCNNWQDAGPIIEKYKIDLLFYSSDGKWDADSAFFEVPLKDSGAPITRNYDENPLKAAMLCFLEMEIKGQ